MLGTAGIDWVLKNGGLIYENEIIIYENENLSVIAAIIAGNEKSEGGPFIRLHGIHSVSTSCTYNAGFPIT